VVQHGGAEADTAAESVGQDEFQEGGAMGVREGEQGRGRDGYVQRRSGVGQGGGWPAEQEPGRGIYDIDEAGDGLWVLAQ